MYGRSGLDRFKKAQSLEPFSVSTVISGSKPTSHSSPNDSLASRPLASEAGPPVTQVGSGQSTWQPPDWAVEPRAGVHYLEVLKDGEVLDRINIDRRRQIFGRQFPMCDFVLDHPSVSRQHAVVVPHKNGSVYVIDLGSVHGTFVANERLTKDTPVELEAGQSLRFAASTRTYILRKNEEALFSHPPPLSEADLPPIPDPSDEEAVVAYNTLMNQYGIRRPVVPPKPRDPVQSERSAKRVKKARVSFRDQVGGELVEVVGFSDGADVETQKIGPIGVKEGTLVGKYESLVQVTMIPKGKERSVEAKEGGFTSPKGVTGKLQEVLDKVKRGTPKSGLYDDLYGESFVGKVGSSWAHSSVPNKDAQQNSASDKAVNSLSQVNDDDDDDLFGD